MSDTAAPSKPKRRVWPYVVAGVLVALFIAHFPIVDYFFGPLHGDGTQSSAETPRSAR